ncbi:MAG: hypothetical protein LBS10_05915 [Gracilibacteraceae bacterium]|nr:hypothetical protein [Gracilibacteraceae bacterium]
MKHWVLTIFSICIQAAIGVKKLLLDQKEFLEKHLLAWIPDFAKQMQRSKTHYFYPMLASFTVEFIKIDLEALDEIISLLV